MQVYHFTEQPYYPAWNNHNGSLRVNLPNKRGRSEDRRRPVPPLLRRVEDRRRARLQHHGQRASPDRDLHVLDRDRRAVGAGARDQERAHPGARLSDRPPPRSAALRRGACHHRRDLARPARHGLHQGRALRIPGVEPESGRRDGPLLGGARLHPQGDDQPRRAVQLGGRVLPLPAGQRLAAPGAAAASAGLDHHRQQVAGARCSARRAT